jgi:transcriptional regulator with XRE-family HTH domain
VNPHTNKTSQTQPALGRAIRQLRQKRGVTLETLAGKTGITLNMLSLIERGEGNPTWATVKGIAAALGVTVSELANAAEKLEGQEPS